MGASKKNDGAASGKEDDGAPGRPKKGNMKLILARHAEAESGTDDFARNLTEAGRADARRMGHLIAATGWKLAGIKHSPLVRARQTAEVLAETLGKSDLMREETSLSPGVNPEAAGSKLLEYGANDVILWVFHAPDVNRFASYLLGVAERALYVPPGTAIALNVSLPPAAGNAVLIWAMQPEYIPKKIS